MITADDIAAIRRANPGMLPWEARELLEQRERDNEANERSFLEPDDDLPMDVVDFMKGNS